MIRAHLRAPRPITTLALAATIAAGAVGCSARPGGPTRPEGHAQVVEVVDGDTIVVALDGAEHTVRILGIDTPETVHPDRPVECHGPEASARLDELLPVGTEVRLERDEELLDPYGRLLAHVVRQPDGLHVATALAREGHADTLVIPPNTAMADELAAAVADARAASLGLWGHCAGPHQPAGP